MSNDLEARLRQALRRRAVATPIDGDWDDVLRRAQRVRDRHHRLIRLVVVLALVAGPVAGYGVARATESDRGSSVVASNAPRGGGDQPAGPVPSPLPPQLGCATTGPSETKGVLRESAGLLCGSFEGLFRRDAGGVSIRAYRAAGYGAQTCPTPAVITELSNVGAVGVGLASIPTTFTTPVVVNAGEFGTPEHTTALWVIVQLGPEVAPRAVSVRAAFRAGDDEMQPVRYGHGYAVAVLAGPAPAGQAVTGDVTVVDRDGATLAHVPFNGTGPSGCLASIAPPTTGTTASTRGFVAPSPTTLPPPGTPPADPAAARRAITDAYQHVYKTNLQIGQGAPYIDDPHGFETALAQLERNIPNAVPSLSITIREIRFVNPTEAAVLYDLTDANGQWPNRIGGAKLVDGTWKITRATVCDDLTLGAVQCPP